MEKKEKSPLKHSTIRVLSLSKGPCLEFCVFVLIIYEQGSRFLDATQNVNCLSTLALIKSSRNEILFLS